MDTRATIIELHDAYLAGDANRIAALIGDDIDWVIHGPANVFPFVGARRGKTAVLETLAMIGQHYDLKRYEHERLIVEGEQAAVVSQTSFVHRATQRTLNMRLINFMRVRDGKIVEFREFSDTLDAVEQAIGFQLSVPAIAV